MFFDANGQRVINDQRDYLPENILARINWLFYRFVLFVVAFSLMLWYANPKLLIDILNRLIDIVFHNAFMEYITEYIRRFLISLFDPYILAIMCWLYVAIMFPVTVLLVIYWHKCLKDVENAFMEYNRQLRQFRQA
jgi:hypothetical protein